MASPVENVRCREGDTPKLTRLGHLPRGQCQGQVLRWSKKDRGTVYTVPSGAPGTKLASGLKDKHRASDNETAGQQLPRKVMGGALGAG